MISSLLGFVFGAIACFYLFVATAAKFVDSETAHTMSIGGVVIACFLTLVSLVLGMVGAFLRGYGVGRVLVYFLFGAVLTFTAFRTFGIYLREWQEFRIRLG